MIRPALLVLLLAASTTAADPPAPVGARVADFILPAPTAGKPWALAEQARGAKAAVVVFLATGCPVNNAYLPRLAELHTRFSKDGVIFVGINSHPADDPAAVAKHTKEHAIPFPILKDDGARLADKFAVERVPTAFVLDAGEVIARWMEPRPVGSGLTDQPLRLPCRRRRIASLASPAPPGCRPTPSTTPAS